MSKAQNHQFDAGDPKKLFDVVEKVGSGSYGDVFKARVIATGALAAVKIIVLEPGENLDDIMIEVNMLRDSHHANIVSYYGCFFRPSPTKGHDSVWIAMEFCGGGSVEAVYKAMGAFSELEIACTMKDLLMGVAYLHESKKIHRDIKGGNLLFTDQGQVKLADFGVSAQLTKTLRKRQTVIGSPYWMAPEVITAEDFHAPYDEKADLWSIGITAIEMAECAPPLYDLHPMRALFMIPKNKAPTLSKKTKWSKDFQDFISCTINKNAKKRVEAKDLLKHPFIANVKNSAAVLSETVEKFKISQSSGAPPRDDSDEEAQTPVQESSGSTLKPAETEAEKSLYAMGFSQDMVKEAVLIYGDDVEKAANWIIQSSEEFTKDLSLARELSETMKIHHSIPNEQIEKDEKLARQLSRGSSSSKASPTLETYRAQKLCRVKKGITCADFWERESALLVGLDEGLVWIKADADNGKQRLASISNRKYQKLQVIEEIDSLISISGKTGFVCLSDLKGFDVNRKGLRPFETETKLKKIKESKGSHNFQVVKMGHEIYVLISKPGAIVVMKWAWHPFNKFMQVKELAIDYEYRSMNLHEQPDGEVKLVLGVKNGFQMVELDGGVATDLIVDEVGVGEKGLSVGSVSLENGGILLCFEDCGFPVTHTGEPAGKIVKWRGKIHTVLSLSDTSMVTLCNDNLVDIFALGSLTLSHTFNNSSPVFPLRMSKTNRVLFGCVEEKAEQVSVSIISILSEVTA